MFRCSLQNKVKVTFTRRKETRSIYLKVPGTSSLTLWHLSAKTFLVCIMIYVAVAVRPLFHQHFFTNAGCGPLLFLLLCFRGAPHFHNSKTVLQLSCVHQEVLPCVWSCSAVLHHLSVWHPSAGPCVSRKSVHKPTQIGAYTCVCVSRKKKPLGPIIIPHSVGHLSSRGPPFTCPTICTVWNASCTFWCTS